MDVHGRHGTLTTGRDVEIWVCANCRSVNKIRRKQCYNCRTPKDRAAVDPLTMSVTSHGRVREISLPDFKPSRPFAILASFLILVVASMQVMSTLVTSSIVSRILDDATPSETEIVSAGAISLATLGVGLLALIGWSAWLSKAVRTMPALGLGYPAANGLMAFVENFLPGWNLYRVPAIVRDIVRRLEPTEGRGGALIFAAWIGLLGGFLLTRFGPIFSALTADTIAGAYRTQLVVQGVSTGLVLVGALFLVVLIWWIEVRIGRRRKMQLTDMATAPAASPAPPPAPTLTSTPTPTQISIPTPALVQGGLSAMGASRVSDGLLNRPITAATGTGHVLMQPAEPPSHVPSGPRLDLRIEADLSMIATLGGESEPITLDELRAAATALADADGSASITTGSTSVEARSRAQAALDIMSDARVQATLEG